MLLCEKTFVYLALQSIGLRECLNHVILELRNAEGAEMQDVKKINTAWVEAINKLFERMLQSYVLYPIAASRMESFRFIDIYENPIH